jgi:SOS-response transcriptional repressor LexA
MQRDLIKISLRCIFVCLFFCTRMSLICYLKSLKMQNLNWRDFSIRLNIALDLRGYPPIGEGRISYLQTIFDISRASANKWIHGRAIPHPNTRKKIAEKLGVSLSWLETGIGEATDIDPVSYHPSNEIKKIPIFSFSELYEIDNLAVMLNKVHAKDTLIVNNQIPNDCFAVSVIGDSMIPKFHSGTLLIVGMNQNIADGDFVIAKSKRFPEALFRQFILGDSGQYLLALNPKFSPIKIDSNEEILGKILESRVIY